MNAEVPQIFDRIASSINFDNIDNFKTIAGVQEARRQLFHAIEYLEWVDRTALYNECAIANQLAEKWLPKSFLKEIRDEEEKGLGESGVMRTDLMALKSGRRAVARAREILFPNAKSFEDIICTSARVVAWDIKVSLIVEFCRKTSEFLDTLNAPRVLVIVPFGGTLKSFQGSVDGGLTVIFKDNSDATSFTIFKNEYDLEKVQNAFMTSFGDGKSLKEIFNLYDKKNDTSVWDSIDTQLEENEFITYGRIGKHHYVNYNY